MLQLKGGALAAARMWLSATVRLATAAVAGLAQAGKEQARLFACGSPLPSFFKIIHLPPTPLPCKGWAYICVEAVGALTSVI